MNTAEALLVLHAGGVHLGSEDPAATFLLGALEEHRRTRGDFTRFLSFAILGLRACSVPATDPTLASAIDALVGRYLPAPGGWGETTEDPPSLFSTYYALAALQEAGFGPDRLSTDYDAAFRRARGLLAQHNDFVPLNPHVGGSLSGTAYATLIVCLSPDSCHSAEIARIAGSLRDQLLRAIRSRRQVDLEPQPNTTWYHYGICLGLRALVRLGHISSHSLLNLRQIAIAVSSILATRDPESGVFTEFRADLGSATTNVRSVYNNAIALAATDGAIGAATLASPPLLAFLGKHYHLAPHASLMGKGPAEVYETAPRYDEKVDDDALGAALTVHGKRRVRRDGTLEIGGTTFETRTGFLAGRVVLVARTLLDVTADPWIEHEGQRYVLGRVDAEENARRKKQGPRANRPRRGLDVPFDPPGALLDALVGRDGGER